MPRLSPRACLQCLAECERAVLDRVMLVDVQIALAGELQREAAVLGDLLEHVIEEAEAGLDVDRRLAIQVHVDLDVGFLGLADHGRHACLSSQASSDLRPRVPGRLLRAHADPLNADVGRQLQIRCSRSPMT